MVNGQWSMEVEPFGRYDLPSAGKKHWILVIGIIVRGFRRLAGCNKKMSHEGHEGARSFFHRFSSCFFVCFVANSDIKGTGELDPLFFFRIPGRLPETPV